MSMTRNGPAREVEPGGGAAEREPRFLFAGQQLGPRRRARARRRRRTVALFAASRAALVAVARTRAAPCCAMATRDTRASTATVRAIASGCSEPVHVDALAEPRDVHRAFELAPRVVGDQQADGVGADVDGRDVHRFTARPPISRLQADQREQLHARGGVVAGRGRAACSSSSTSPASSRRGSTCRSAGTAGSPPRPAASGVARSRRRSAWSASLAPAGAWRRRRRRARSCSARRRARSGMYATCALPTNGTMWCSQWLNTSMSLTSTSSS